MFRLSILIFIMISVATVTSCKKSENNSKTVNGAGASFPFPLYSIWAYKYNKAKNIKINYQSVGSGAGIAQIKKKTVDFGASDKPLKEEELEKYGLMQFPMAMGGVVPVFNIPGIKSSEIKLSGDILAKIFLGEIKKWDDPELKKLNPELKLPSTEIKVVHRADGSGTTWIFTNYLSKVSIRWKSKIGNGKSVKWPVGIGAKGNEGVAGVLRKNTNSIGYVEYAYAIQTKLSVVSLKNRAGKFVTPSIPAFQASAASADWKNSKGFYVVLTDQPGDNSWPITGATFILIYKKQKDRALALTMLKYFDWCFKNGNADATKLHYIPMPDSVVSLIEETWKKSIKVNNESIWK